MEEIPNKDNGQVQANRKLVRSVRKMRGKAAYLTEVPAADLYDYVAKHFDETRGIAVEVDSKRINVARTVNPPSLIKHVVGSWEQNGNLVFPVPVVHLTNSQDKDERNFRPPVELEVLKSFAENEWVCFAGKHLYPAGLMHLFARTFPKAVDGCYIRSLGAPTIGNGIFTDLSFAFRDITAIDSNGNEIHAGCDGSGRIHPAHPVFERIGTVCPIQIRIWNIHQGAFAKGILVPDDRCTDEDGRPDIWVDWLQVKGGLKDRAKSNSGMKNGAFNSEGLLVDEERLIIARPSDRERKNDLDRWNLAILQVWDRPGTIRWCFEVLERVRDTNQNRAFVVEFLQEALQKLEDKGGLQGILERIAEEDPKIALTVKLCEKLSERSGVEVSPMQIPFIWDYIQDELQRQLYHFRQGAGKRSERFVIVMNAAVPSGMAVIGPARNEDGSRRFKHGDEIAVTRFPMIAPQSLRVLKCITPSRNRYPHLLESCTIKTERGQRVPQQCIYMNPFDVEMMQGDDDGDTVLVDSDPRVITMFKERIAVIPGNPDASFLIEPGKVANSWKSKVPMIEPDGSVSAKAVEILGLDSRGPVGPLTYYLSLFIAIGDLMAARACFVLIQEAIDSGKHVVLLSDPDKLVIESNWKEVESNVFSPVNCKAKENGRWYDSSTGTLNMQEFSKWVFRRAGVKLQEVLTWRNDEGTKRTRDDDWGIKDSPAGENLVHYCNKAAYYLWQAWKEDNNLTRCEPVSLTGLLPATLGLSLEELTIDPRQYRILLNRSGLSKFQAVLNDIRKSQKTVEERNRLVDAASQELAHSLSQLSVKELCIIWSSELTDPKNLKSGINRAFRTICFNGSPILESLGVEMDNTCPFLNGDNLDNVFGQLLVAVEQGLEVDIFYAAENWTSHLSDDLSSEEQDLHGEEECHHCRKLIRAKAVSHARNSKQSTEQVKSVISTMCRAVNPSLLQKSLDGKLV